MHGRVNGPISFSALSSSHEATEISAANASDGGMIGLENRNTLPQVLRKYSVLYLRYLRRPAALKTVSSERLGSFLCAIFLWTRSHKFLFGKTACFGTP